MNIEEYEKYRQKSYQGPRMTALFKYFGEIASGKLQPPQKSVEVSFEFLSQDRELLKYHQLFQQNMGYFYHHYCTSVPFVTEELYRLGLAICRLAEYLSKDQDRYFTCFNTTGEDDAQGITMAKYSNGLIRTLTNSPNIESQINFYQSCNPEYSKFYLGSFVDITPEYIASQPDLEIYKDGFDFIHASITFQVYSSNRVEQIGYIKRLLKKDGLMIIMEKLKHPNPKTYEKFEKIKDEQFKSHYYLSEEIEWKESTFLQQCINVGQVDFNTCVTAIKKYFKYVYLIWNSGNFYEFVASNNKVIIDKFISLLVVPYIPSQFKLESNIIRNL